MSTPQKSATPPGAITREDWARHSALLDEALDLDAPARAAWLADLAARDAAAAEAVRRLLARETPALADALLSTDGSSPVRQGFESLLQAVLTQEDSTDAAQPGQCFGPWQVSRKLGVGGMGEVWLAARSDALYEGHAAIKLLRNTGDASRLAGRFARERQALARLIHPGIARLLDAGVQDGQTYLVLDYVRGQPLLDHARALAPSVSPRVQLALAVGRALEYAHGRLIVHRDIKPSNVMVTAEGEVKLLDFGIASLLDDEHGSDTSLTGLYGRGLTLDYAAPEQISGEPTGVACDVFSLGVLLFELLSGTRPFKGEQPGRAALEYAVLHHDAPRLSKAIATPLPADAAAGARPVDARAVRGDLEAIVAKALRKAPQDRYPTMAAFMADLERWLEHRPVSAAPDDWRYRSRLWLRRNRVVAVLSGVIVASLVAGLGISLAQTRRALKAEAEAEKQAEQAELRRVFAFDLLQGTDAAIVGAAAIDAASLKMLDLAASRVDENFKNSPLLAAEMKSEIAVIYYNRGLYDQALTLSQQALALYQQAPAQPVQLVRAWYDMGDNQKALGALAEAETAYLQAIRIGHENPMPAYPDNKPFFMALASLGDVRRQLGRFDEALPPLQEAVQLLAVNPGIEDSRYLELQMTLGRVYRSAERFDEALKIHQSSVRLRELKQLGESHHLASDLLEVGRVLLALGRYAEALSAFEQAYKIYAVALGEDHPNCHYLLTFQGEALMGDGRYLEAEKRLRESLRLRATEPQGGALTFNTRWRLAMNALARGDLSEAETEARTYLTAERANTGERSTFTSHGMEVLAEVLSARGEHEEAEALLRQALVIAQEKMPAPSVVVGRTRMRLARVLSASGQHTEALSLAQLAIDNLHRKLGDAHVLSAEALTTLGLAQLAAGSTAASLTTLQAAVSRMRAAYRQGHPRLADALIAQAQALVTLGREGEALPLRQEAQQIIDSQKTE
ncbi:MAG: tetratricopeptide repeat protein [Pseudomonadota bacterium]